MINIIIQIIMAVLQALLPALLNRENSFEDAKKQTVLKKRLNDRIDKSWGKAAIPLVLACILLGGCSSKIIYVPDGEPVKIRETIKNAKVWTLDSDGKPVAGKMDIPAGWFALPDTREDGE